MRFEQDELTLIGGVRHGRTLGSPIAIEIANTEWPKWEQEMSPAPGHTDKPLTRPPARSADLQDAEAGMPATSWNGPLPERRQPSGLGADG